MDEITECSKRVEQLAVSAHRAETRGMHLRIVKMEQLAMGESCQLARKTGNGKS